MDLVFLVLAVGLGAVTGFFASRLWQREEPHHENSDDEWADSALLEVIPQSYMIVGPTLEVEQASTLAYSLGLVRGNRITRSEILNMMRAVQRNSNVETAEFEIRRSSLEDAGLTSIEVRVTKLGHDHVLVLFYDNTTEKRLEDTRRDFVANISHELKTPIGAIGLLAETIEDCADEPDHVAQFASQMRRESKRLASLVQDIIQLTRLQDTDAVHDPALLDMNDIVSDAIEWSKVEADNRDIDLVYNKTEGISVYGDRALLTTAVRNLLDNAIRYSAPKTRVAIGARVDDGVVHLAIVDQGVGIPKTQQDRVFERFYRGDEARTTETGGSGLGLSIVKHVAADHGGRIDLWSEPGKGSTFTLVLPQAQGPDVGSEAKEKES